MRDVHRPTDTLAVVIPLYCEGAHLAGTLKVIVRALDDLDMAYRLVLVDDGSSDDTWHIVQAHCRDDGSVQGLRLSRNFGKEAALAAGLEQAEGDAIVVMDGDLQHPPELIARMIDCWRAGADVVEGVKQRRDLEAGWRGAGAKLFYRLFTGLSGYELRGASDFKLMDRRVLAAWRAMGERSLFFRGMNAWLGFKRAEIAFAVPARAGGDSGWSAWQLVRLAMSAITAFSSAPLYLVALSGVGFTLFALLLAVQTLYLKLSGQAVDGFTTVILLILLVGGVVLLALGIIGSYIARIYEEVKGRPRYVVAETAGPPR